MTLITNRVAQSEFRNILRFRVVAEKCHSARAKYRESQVGGGGVVAEPSMNKSVDSSENLFFSEKCLESRKCNEVVGGGGGGGSRAG